MMNWINPKNVIIACTICGGDTNAQNGRCKICQDDLDIELNKLQAKCKKQAEQIRQLEDMLMFRIEDISRLKDELLRRPPLPLEGEARSRILQETKSTGIDDAILKFNQQAEQIERLEHTLKVSLHNSQLAQDATTKLQAENARLKEKVDEYNEHCRTCRLKAIKEIRLCEHPNCDCGPAAERAGQ